MATLSVKSNKIIRVRCVPKYRRNERFIAAPPCRASATWSRRERTASHGRGGDLRWPWRRFGRIDALFDIEHSFNGLGATLHLFTIQRVA
jgi:hypothetical protein